MTALALCKPYVQGVQWTHFRDAEPHQFPHCGLLDARGPAQTRLAETPRNSARGISNKADPWGRSVPRVAGKSYVATAPPHSVS